MNAPSNPGCPPGCAWIVVAALAFRGVFDAFHDRVLDNPGVPAWWPAWCLAYDVGAAAGLRLALTARAYDE